MESEKQRKTFLSYSRVNKDFAIRLAKELKSEGFDVWLDQLDIPAGSRWDREVERALKESEIFMIILTSASVDSENVLDEIGFAIDNRKRILPVLLENCDVPFRLRRFQYVDFTNKDFDDGVESAKDLLRGLIAQPTIPRGVPAFSGEAQAKAETDRISAQKVEEERLAKQKAEEERVAKAKAEKEQKEKEEADRLAKQKAEDELAAKTKVEKERKAKEEAEHITAQKAEVEHLAQQKAEEERLAKAKAEADRKAKEEADRLVAQKAEAERTAKEKMVAAETKAVPVAVAPVQKKPASKGLMYGVGAVVVLTVIEIAVVGIGYSVLTSGNKNSPASTPTTNAVSAPATKEPATPTTAPANTATIAPTPIGGGSGKNRLRLLSRQQ